VKPIAIVLAACAVFSAAVPAIAATERVEAWGRGTSEFEAVKSAYKQLFAEALKLSTANAATMEGSLRRVFVRDIEEDLLRVQNTYFPGAAAPRCTEVREGHECQVVALVQMDEVDARIKTLFAETGAGVVVRDLRLAIVSKQDDVAVRDLIDYLHTKLESDFGHDVLRSQDYVDVSALRDGCGEYERRAKDAEARGDSHQKTAQAYRRSLTACRELVNRDLIIVIDSADKRFGEYSAGKAELRGEVTVRMQLHMTSANRSLPAPRPQSITQFGRGEDADFARSSANNRLNEAASNYIAQQMNAALVGYAQKGGGKPVEGAERDYKVLVSGINPDTADGRAQIRLVTDWFSGQGGFPLDPKFTDGNFGEKVYTFRSSRTPQWSTLTDQLQATLDQARQFARIDVDRSLNLSVAFQPNDALKPKASVEVIVEAKRAKRRIAVDERSMEVRRRDPESGTAIAVNEAMLRIRNKLSRDLLITVTPVWRGQDGSSLPAPYSYRQTVRVPAKSSESFTFMAPSKFAGPVTIELSCPEKGCEMPQ
jgi:hypothetical protein